MHVTAYKMEMIGDAPRERVHISLRKTNPQGYLTGCRESDGSTFTRLHHEATVMLSIDSDNRVKLFFVQGLFFLRVNAPTIREAISQLSIGLHLRQITPVRIDWNGYL